MNASAGTIDRVAHIVAGLALIGTNNGITYQRSA
jgi:hypothetical protein